MVIGNIGNRIACLWWTLWEKRGKRDFEADKTKARIQKHDNRRHIFRAFCWACETCETAMSTVIANA